MTPGGRASAAIEILADVLDRNRPAGSALRDWGRANRYAGSSDRSAIGNLVYAALRRKLSLGAAMGGDDARSLILGVLRWVWGETPDAIAAMINGENYAPPALSEAEKAAIAGMGVPEDAAPHIRADVPGWLWPAFEASFGDRAHAEAEGLASRPPVDIRTNTLKTTREKLTKALSRHEPVPTPLSPVGLRFATPEGPKRHPNVEAEIGHGRGHFEIQDEGSQLAALLAGARPGLQVVDFCAGAGGKTLALAAQMAGKGQVHAHDSDARRLKPLVERMRRAGAHNVQIHDGDGLGQLTGKADIVFVDAPCTGSGTWRRRPETKWRLKPEALERRIAEQAAILDDAARFVKPGGRLVYVTCSVLGPENGETVDSFLGRASHFTVLPVSDAWETAIGTDAPHSAGADERFLQLTPASHGTDGFFIALLERSG